MKTKVSDYVIEYLYTLGIKDVFYVPGGGAMHMNNSLGENPNVNAVSMIFEQGAAIAAEAYARGLDGFGACLVTSGPGATNALTGLVGAYIDSIPVIFISGQAKIDDLVGNQGIRQFGIQEVDIISMAKPYAKYAVQIHTPEDIVYELQKAAAIACSGRPGPVWIDVPLDMQASLVDICACKKYEEADKPIKYAKGESLCEKEADVDETIQLLNTSERPVLYLGHGIRLDHAVQEARQLYEMLGIPVVTSWNGVDLIESSHPLYMGRPGGVGHRAANMIVHKADLVITLGTRLNLLATGYNFDSFLENATHVMVDIDEKEMQKKSVHPEIKVVASAYSFITKLLARREDITLSEEMKRNWLDSCRKLTEKYPVRIPEQECREGYISNYDLAEEIGKQMRACDMYQFTSSGTTVDITMKVLELKKNQRSFLTKGLASMGYDIPACIGSAYANRRLKEHNVSGREVSDDSRVVCITGDGSAAMNLQELEVIAREQLPVKLFISDNSGYSMIYGSQNGNFHRLTGADKTSGLTLPPMARVASALGIYTVELTDPEKLEETVKDVFAYQGPVLCNVRTDIEQKILPRQCNYMKEDGQMASRPLYDMAPLIDAELLEKELAN